MWLVSEGRVHRTSIDPQRLGMSPAAPADLQGGDPAHNAQVVRDLVAGKRDAVRDITVLNAAAAVLAYRGVSHVVPLEDQIGDLLGEVGEAIDSGAAASTLERWVDLTNR